MTGFNFFNKSVLYLNYRKPCVYYQITWNSYQNRDSGAVVVVSPLLILKTVVSFIIPIWLDMYVNISEHRLLGQLVKKYIKGINIFYGVGNKRASDSPDGMQCSWTFAKSNRSLYTVYYRNK